MIMGMMVPLNNPAGRLHRILAQAQENLKGRAHVSDVWHSVLGLSDELDLTQQMAGLLAVLDEVIELLRSSRVSPTHFSAQLYRVAQALSPILFGRSASELGNHLDDSSLGALGLCASVLDGRSEESLIDADDLSGLKSDVDELLQKLVDTDIDQTLTEVIIVFLHRILRAISDYHIYGSAGLRRALETAVGTMVMQEDLFQPLKESSIFKDIGDLIRKVCRMAHKAKHELGELPSIGKFLPSNHS